MRKSYVSFVWSVAMSLPGTKETTTFGTKSFRVGEKPYARMHDDDATLVLKIDAETRQKLIQDKPDIYYITESYANFPLLLVRLDQIDEAELRAALELAWRSDASPELIEQYEAGQR